MYTHKKYSISHHNYKNHVPHTYMHININISSWLWSHQINKAWTEGKKSREIEIRLRKREKPVKTSRHEATKALGTTTKETTSMYDT